MTQYRKKPVTIEAVRFDGLNPTEIKDFVGENCEVKIYDNEVTPSVTCIVIHTLEGDMKVSKGDYVIKGVKGEFYPCKPDIFEQTHESIESQKGLDEAAKEIAYSVCRQLPNGKEKDNIVYYAILAAKAGAKWMAEHLAGVRKMIEPEKKEGRTDCSSQGEVPDDSLATQSYENIPNDLEEAAREYAQTTFKKPYSENPDEEVTIVEPDKYAGFIAGAKWDREQMVSEAVEGEVRKDGTIGYFEFSNEQQFHSLLEQFQDCDKVRIIVCKKED